MHTELTRDVLSHLVGRGRRQSEDRRSAETLHDRTEHQIIRAKIVAPLADAVRFVNDEEADGPGQESLEKVAVFEALWSQIENLAFAVEHALLEVASFRLRKVRM